MAVRAISRASKHEFVSLSDDDRKMVDEPRPADAPEGWEPTKKVLQVGPDATRFALRGLDVPMMGHIYDSSQVLSQNGEGGEEGTKVHLHINKTNIEAVRFGLTGWTNFRDDAGNDVPFKTTKRNVHGRSYETASDETIDLLGIELVQEIGAEVKRISRLSKDEAKNSDAA